MSVDPHGPSSPLPTRRQNWNLEIPEMFPRWIKYDAMASMKKRYGMTTYMTCPHSWITNDHMYTASNEDHPI